MTRAPFSRRRNAVRVMAFPVMVGALLIGSAPLALAAEVGPVEGTITVTPATGNDQVAFSLTTSKACPSGGTNAFGTVFGPGLPATGINVVPNSANTVFPHTVAGGLVMSSSNTLRTLVSQLPDPQPLKGTYKLRVQCRGPAKIADLGDFFGSMVFDGHHGYVAVEPDVPKASLVTVAPASAMPIPTAVGSEPPAARGATPTGKVTPTTKATSAAVATTSGGGGSGGDYGPWLIGIGALCVAAGLATLIRSRRSRTPQLAKR
jgi:hypothetical protein